MKLKIVLILLVTLMFLTANVTTGIVPESVLTREAKLTREGDSPQTTRATTDHSTFDQQELNKASVFSNAETGENLVKSRSPNIFPLDSFANYISSVRTDMWHDFVKVDEDSVELVIGVNSAQPDSYMKISDLIVERRSKLVNTVSIEDEVIAVVAELPLDSLPSFLKDVQASNLARYIEPNMKYQTQLVPNDPDWNLQWGPQKIEADWAWNTTTGDPSVLVAVIDTGIDYDHPDIAANYVALGYDWVNIDNDPIDDNGHGTHCAGVIAAELDNTIGIAGVAQVSIMAEKGLDQYGWGYEDDLANAIIHAVDQGADILSNSWGSYFPSMLIYDAIQYASDEDVLVVAAAGNEATSQKHYPAAYDAVIAVTATDQYDNPAWFTNFGEWVEVAAPGVDIYSTVWDDSYTWMSGTSMAAPHASGVAALIWSQFPSMTRDWVRAQLRYTTDDLDDLDFDDYYGYGRINARRAVEEAPSDHDLLIFDWKRPQYVKLGELSTFNTTVLNFGTSNETSIEVQLLADSSLVDSTSIPSLPKGASTTVELSWTPLVEGTYNVTSYVVPVPDETITQNNLITEFVTVVPPPPEANWILLATDPDEGAGTNLKAIYGQLYSDIIYFKVEHHWPWTTINDIDTAIFVDADQDPNTGLPDGNYPGQNTGIGADYVIVVGWEATEMWKWDPIAGFWDVDNPISLAYLDAPDGSNVFEVGVYLASVETDEALDCAVSDIPSNWDWMPDTGYFTLPLVTDKLSVSLETPMIVEPGDSTLLNATVYNVGLDNETNVELQLLINSALVNSTTIPELLSGSSYTLRHLWTPTTEAIYNVTAYAPPVPLEEYVTNNMATKMVHVRPIRGYVLFDQTHWTDSIFDYNIWVSDLFDRGYVVDTLTTSPIAQPMLKGYDVFVVPQAHDYYTSDELSAIQNFVLDGGGLLVIGDDAPYIYTELTSFAGITWDWGGYWGYTNDITPHPVTEGVTTAYFDSPGLVRVASPAQDIIRDYYGNVMLAVSEVGAGAVIGIADEHSIIDWNIEYADNLRLANNMIDWLKSRRPVASFTYSPMDPYVGETVTFDASDSYDPDGTVVSYIWDFGDDTSGNGNITTHAYVAGGIYTIALTVVDNENLNSTSTIEIAVSRTTLDIKVEVGSMHFRGEIAEFYILVSSLGNPVDANINATLYYNETLYENLTDDVNRITTGFYRIPYTVPTNAAPGTYALVVEANYLSLKEVSLKSFLLSPTLTGWNALLININGTVGTIKTDVGLIEVKLDDINATLVSIDGKVATIVSDIGTIKTDLSSINAKLTSIEGRLATIETDIGTIKGTITSIQGDIATIETDIGAIKTILEGWTGGTTSSIITPVGTFQILVLTTSALEGPIEFSDNIVAVTLGGPSGTAGTTNIVIPKKLLVGIESSIDEVVVTVDDEQVVFTYTEQPEAYLLTITYTHSIHTIKIYLAGLPSTPVSWVLYVIATAITVLAVSALLTVYILKIRKPRVAKTK